MADYSSKWRRPEDVLKIRNMKTKKRALHDRLFENEAKKSKKSTPAKRGKTVEPPPPDEQTCDDSTLMDLLNMKHPSNNNSGSLSSNTSEPPSFSLSFSTSASPSSSSTSMSPQRPKDLFYTPPSQNSQSPIRSYLPALSSIQHTPPAFRYRRQQLNPAPSSPSRAKSNQKESLVKPAEVWHKQLCIDWSLKTKLLITSSNPFAWSSNNLKMSEESSGTSAFVRCVDIEPSSLVEKSQSTLDTSLLAQFHQCCLYWQHPYLPTVTLFPRDGSTISGSLSYANMRLEDKVFNSMQLEWIDAFRSAFQLLRTRQCPYFYVCANQFTSLFCAAGTQGGDEIQIFITPSTKGFREALKSDGIEFSMPYFEAEKKTDVKQSVSDKLNSSINSEKDLEEESDGEADKFLDEIGVSQDINVSYVKLSPTSAKEEKSKSSLVLITGAHTLQFFNFLIKSKQFLVSSTGPFAYLPPTILSPVAFHGATLSKLKIKQNKLKNSQTNSTNSIHSIEMHGPILPHIVHFLCSLLATTVKDFKIKLSTLNATVPLNINSSLAKGEQAKPSAFHIQNLSDCGLRRSILEKFCRYDNCETITDSIDCSNSQFRWS